MLRWRISLLHRATSITHSTAAHSRSFKIILFFKLMLIPMPSFNLSLIVFHHLRKQGTQCISPLRSTRACLLININSACRDGEPSEILVYSLVVCPSGLVNPEM